MDLDPEQLPGGKKSERDRGPEVNPYYRLALMIVWLVAAGCVIVGGMNLAVYWVKCHSHELGHIGGVSGENLQGKTMKSNEAHVDVLQHEHERLKIGRCLYLSIPLVVGLLMLVKSSALAHRLEQLFED